jgi:hypothetical protein
LSIYPSGQVVHPLLPDAEQLEQLGSQDWQVEEMVSKYADLGQYSIHLPLDNTGRLAGHVRHDDEDRGVEQVAQSEEQGRQVPLVGNEPEGQVWMHFPFEAESGGGHVVHVEEVVWHSEQEESQAVGL